MAKTWDNLMKRMVAANPQHFLNWLIPGAVLVRELSPLLKTRDLEADGLYVILWYGMEVILHLEFQRRGDTEMGRRLWEYNTTTIINSGLPVLSIVIYLRKERKMVEPPYVYMLPDSAPLHVFAYQAVRLWDKPAELFFQPGLEGLLPLVTLTQDGKRREIVDAMIQRLIASNKTNLLTFAYTFAVLAFSEAEITIG
jgi:predicted transposase YdaD